MTVKVKVEGMDQPVDARIARIAPAAEPGTRSIGVTLTMDNPKEAYRAGQYAVATAVLQDDKQRLTLPITAITRNSGQEQVWLIENGMLARRIVTTGRSDARDGRVEILGGIKTDAQVLGARFENLREGDKAVIVSAKSKIAVAAGLATVTQ
jgi:multidrug efflux pump subunit AcrA (membrane-fusion protein)